MGEKKEKRRGRGGRGRGARREEGREEGRQGERRVEEGRKGECVCVEGEGEGGGGFEEDGGQRGAVSGEDTGDREKRGRMTRPIRAYSFSQGPNY